ncbi:MAG: glycogen synthase [Actinobacteria bacterium]|nr:glycogen synthase [Actinomycetota bacterium]
MRVDFVTKEYPPHIYGGAGVHITELVKVLRNRIDARVHAFGSPVVEPGTFGYQVPTELEESNSALQTMGVDLLIADALAGADLVHSHTWYANFAGHIGSMLHSIPHVVTAHSLEPLRPWKREQLGGGYELSSYIERTAYQAASKVIAVSNGMRNDILRSYPDLDPGKVEVVYNGIDSQKWRPIQEPDTVRALGVDPDRRSVIFVGRITRQKGLPYFLRAARELPSDVQLILCAGAPDTEEIKLEVEQLVAELARNRSGVVWIPEHLPQHKLAALLTNADAFVCPSIYEPLGIVNLEAMACGVPVIGTATGGIPEVVVEGETGWLVPIEQVQDGSGAPIDADKFVSDWAEVLNSALASGKLKSFGQAGRVRAEREFSWESIATRTIEVYQRALGD